MAESILLRLAPGQAGTLWIGLLVTFLVFGDHVRLRARGNLALLLLLALAVPLVDVLPLSHAPVAPWIWRAILAVTSVYLLWALALSRRTPVWQPRISRNGLRVIAILLIGLDAAVAFGRPPDDAGRYTNLGTQRWLETGSMPYADELLRGADSPGRGASATYGPLLYMAHVPPQLLLGRPGNPADMSPRDPDYVQPPRVATQIVAFAFFLLGLAALYGIVRRDAGEDVALGVVALWAASPFLIGIGSDGAAISGIRFISHIAPASLTLAALLALRSPVLAGVLLAAAAGTLFYPVFFFPAWFGWYAARDGRKALRFVFGCAIAGAAMIALVLALTHPPPDESTISLFLDSTFGHQEGSAAGQYGASVFGFWGTHPEFAAFWNVPLFGTSFATRPVFLLFAALVVASLFLARARTRPQLAALTAAVAIGLQLWKTHGGGTYIGWYYPLLLIGLFAGVSSEPESDRQGHEINPEYQGRPASVP